MSINPISSISQSSLLYYYLFNNATSSLNSTSNSSLLQLFSPVNNLQTSNSFSAAFNINRDLQTLEGINNGISALSTESSALNELIKNTTEINGLATQVASGGLNSTQIQDIQKQVDKLTQANSSIISNTQFNGSPLLKGTTSTTIQTSASSSLIPSELTIETANLDAAPASGGLNSFNIDTKATGTINVSSQSSASNALSLLSMDLKTLTGLQSTLNTNQKTLSNSITNVSTDSLNNALSIPLGAGFPSNSNLSSLLTSNGAFLAQAQTFAMQQSLLSSLF